MAVLLMWHASSTPARAVSSSVVISQVYGGGGNAGATYRNDFIELFNLGTSAISLNGWSVQYASAAGTSWQVTPLTNFTLQPGQYYLIQEAAGAGGTLSLPSPDATGTIAMAAGAGKVALVNTTAPLSGTGCPFAASVVDFVGYGAANCSESTPAPGLSNTTSASRAGGGATDTDNNATDFTSGAPNPRSSSPSPVGSGGASPNPVAPGGTTLLTVAVTPGQNPTSTGIAVVANLTAIGGSSAQSFFDDGTNGDVAAGNNIFSFLATVPSATTLGPKTLSVTISDSLGRSSATSIVPTVANPAMVVISQVYGGGGNSGATYTHDFVELFNRGSVSLDLAGMTLQHTSAAGANWSATVLSGSIAPGAYYLVQQAAGTGGTTALPTPDAIGTAVMGASDGKVALVNGLAQLSGGGCPFGTSVVDFVGYGGASCFEGSGPTPSASNTNAVLRRFGGCADTNANSANFVTGLPNPRNSASAIRDCAAPIPFVAIHDIQGAGGASPFEGTAVRTTGVVTAVRAGSGGSASGFFMQVPADEADANPDTSEGLFVFTGPAPGVQVGDAVSALGVVAEFFGLTELNSHPSDIVVSSSGNSLPDAIELTTGMLDPDGPPDQLERLEGMRVSAGPSVTVAPSDFGEFFTVLAGVARPFREPGIDVRSALPPGAPADVPRFDANPERLAIDSDGQLGAAPLTVTSGVSVGAVSGPLDFSFGNYKLLPDAPPTVSGNMSAVAVPVPGAAELTVSSVNLLNFFSTNSNFAARLNKASLAIREVMRSPDVIGIEEIGDLTTLQALADKLNADTLALPGGTDPDYEAYLFESDDDSEQDIDVGLLVKRSRVDVVSVTQEGKGETYINPLNGLPELLNDRTPLVLRATVARPGSPSPMPFTVIVNHLRSLIDVEQDPGDGPRVREKRRKQAEFLAELIQSLQEANAGENIVSVGDYNAFQFNDGYVDLIGTIKGAPTPANQVVLASEDLVDPNLTDLVDGIDAGQRYSFIFEGNPQVLDHILVNGNMLQRLTRFAYARNNADFPESFAANQARSERLSDHDMPVAYFSLSPIAELSITKAAAPNSVLSGSNLGYTITVSNAGPDAAASVVVQDVLPLGTSFVSCGATAGGVCGGSGANRNVSFESLPAGASATISLVVAVDCSSPNGSSVSNTATLTSTTGDPDASNDSATVAATVSNPPPTITIVGANPLNHELGTPFVDPGATATDNCATIVVTTLGAVDAGTVGSYTLTYTADDGGGNVVTATRTVHVVDTTPPDIEAVRANPHVLWPPNGDLERVTIRVTASDEGGTPACRISDVDSDEPQRGRERDWIVTGPLTLKLRAEREDWRREKDGRTYTITVTCSDASGNSDTETTTVIVPHDRRRGGPGGHGHHDDDGCERRHHGRRR